MNIRGNIKFQSRVGNNLAFLIEDKGLYTAYLFSVKYTLRGRALSLVAKQNISEEEALHICRGMSLSTPQNSTLRLNGHVLDTSSAPSTNSTAGTSHHAYSECDLLCLPIAQSHTTTTDTAEKKYTKIISPYFPTRYIFLSSQMTCAPNL